MEGITKFQQNGNTEEEEKRTFTNSKKVIPEQKLDPNVPTVTRDTRVVAKVTAKEWDD